MEGGPRDLRPAIRQRRLIRLQLVVLLLTATGWGVWCWLLVTEYVVDYAGEEWSVGVFSVILNISVWAVLIVAAVATWRWLQRPTWPR